MVLAEYGLHSLGIAASLVEELCDGKSKCDSLRPEKSSTKKSE